MEKEALFMGVATGERGITLKSPREVKLMRQAGKVVAQTIATLVEAVRPGMKTAELDDIAFQEIKRLGAKPSFKGYLGYPGTICVSINNEIVHGIPGGRTIREGDLLSLDVGAIVEGFHGDAAVSVGVGEVSLAVMGLIDVTREALERGTAAATHGARIGDISSAIQSFVEEKGYSVVREYVGHGIGRALHEEPQVPNFGSPGTGTVLRKGMTIAIEPMVNIGGWQTRVLKDDWTVVTADGSLSAHFENTLLITEGDAEVLTRL
ncbi:MAG: type I methionyl aminopeptidase [Chloroflexi bacterium]|nr:type I methionyl aminopeptidase [Chloroflexota bacterium]